ncbi:MAG: hypothetical protein QM796_11005 [Chthoniobacteraceae bacterium]
MTEKIGHIKNPLTIIAIFAGLAEVGGTIVLPILQPNVQALYVWFLMIFPTSLVGVFFFVLYHKHQVLYAPSDYHSDHAFQQVLQTSLTVQNVKDLELTTTPLVSQLRAATGSEIANAQAALGMQDFAALQAQTRKVIKTLWTFQKKQFPNDLSKRWGFGIGIGAPDYMEFSTGLLEAIKYGLAVVGPRGLCFLSEVGVAYCEQHNEAIEAEPEFYRSFSN